MAWVASFFLPGAFFEGAVVFFAGAGAIAFFAGAAFFADVAFRAGAFRVFRSPRVSSFGSAGFGAAGEALAGGASPAALAPLGRVVRFEGSGGLFFVVRVGFLSMVLVLIGSGFRPFEDTTSRLRARGRSVAPGLGSLSGGPAMIRDRP